MPFDGWLGIASAAPAVALLAAVLGRSGQRVLATLLAAGAAGALLIRLLDPPSSPIPALDALDRTAFAPWAVGLALGGAVLVAAVTGVGHGPRAGRRAGTVPWLARVRFLGPLGPVLGTRVLVLVAGIGAVALLGSHADVRLSPLDRPFGPLGNTLIAPLAAWDSGTYLSIAREGYAGGPYFRAFFPLYPDVIRLLAPSAGAALIWGAVVSLGCGIAAAELLTRLLALDHGPRLARRTVTVIVALPTAFVFSAVYSESLFLLLSVAALHAARRGRWGIAGLAGAGAVLTRSTGIVLLVPLLVLLLGARPPGGRGRAFAALALLPLADAGWLGYLAAHGGPGPFRAEELFWGRHLVPFAGIWRGANAVVHSVAQLTGSGHLAVAVPPGLAGVNTPDRLAIENLIDAAAALLALGGLWLGRRRMGPALGLYALTGLALVLSEPAAGAEPLASLPRYVLVLFPLWIGWADWIGRARWRRPAWFVPSLALLALCSGWFARGLWVA